MAGCLRNIIVTMTTRQDAAVSWLENLNALQRSINGNERDGRIFSASVGLQRMAAWTIPVAHVRTGVHGRFVPMYVPHRPYEQVIRVYRQRSLTKGMFLSK